MQRRHRRPSLRRGVYIYIYIYIYIYMRERLACARCMLRRHRGKHVALILRVVCSIDMPRVACCIDMLRVACCIDTLRVACCIDMLRVAESFLNTVLEIGGARKSMARFPYLSPYNDYPYPYWDYPYPLSRLSVALSLLCVRWLALARLQVHAPQETSPLLRAHAWSPKHTVRTAPERPTRTHSRTAGDPTPPTANHTVADQCRTCARLRGRHCNGNCCTSGDGTRAQQRAHTRQYAMLCARASPPT